MTLPHPSVWLRIGQHAAQTWLSWDWPSISYLVYGPSGGQLFQLLSFWSQYWDWYYWTGIFQESFHFKTKTNKIIIEKYYWEKSHRNQEKNYLVFKVKLTSSRNHHQSLKMKLVFLLKNAAFSQDFSNIIQFSERKLRDLTFGFSLRYLCISKFSYKTLKEYTI